MSANKSIQWGIDLGTTNSGLAILHGDRVRMIDSKNGRETTPSVVYFTKDENGQIEAEVGDQARAKLKMGKAQVAQEFKAFMGNPGWSFEGHPERAFELSARVLRELKNSLRAHGDLPPLSAAVITVPAVFDNPAVEDTLRAGAEAGIQHVELLKEPVAAALAYGRQMDTTHNPIWLAYDLGGGTFDVALVRGEDGVFDVIDHTGDRNLGGKDLDEAIVWELIVPRLPDALATRVLPGSTEYRVLKAMAEEAKCVVSVQDHAQVEGTIGGQEVSVRIKQDEVEALSAKIFGGTTLDLCRVLLARNGFTATNIERVILVGGSTLSPFVRRMIQQGSSHLDHNGKRIVGLGIKTDSSVNPLTAVAEGAAIFAAGRRSPVPPPAESESDAKVRVELKKMPPQVREADLLVAGALLHAGSGRPITERWAVVFHRLDASGKPVWQSEPLSVSEAGKFTKRVSLEEGQNTFRIEVLDAKRDIVPVQSGEFQVNRGITVAGSKLFRGIGVANDDGQTVWAFKTGRPLPATWSRDFSTTVTLQKGSSGDALVVPVVQGSSDKAHLNLKIWELNLPAVEVPTTIPRGSLITVHLKIDESESFTATAELPDYGIHIGGDKVYLGDAPKELRKQLDAVRKDLELFREVSQSSDNVGAVLTDVENALARVDDQLAAGSKANPQPWRAALDGLLSLAQTMDPCYAEVDTLLGWAPHQERCDGNIALGEGIIAETPGVSQEWKATWNRLVHEYRDACARRDFKRTEELAFGELPGHFANDPKLKERVGGTTTGEGSRMRTAGGEALRGTIK